MAGDTENGSGRRESRWRIAVWGTAGLMLLLPLVAMQFTDEVAWGPADFALFGAMLFVACGTYELAARMTGNRAYRAAVGVALAAARFQPQGMARALAGTALAQALVAVIALIAGMGNALILTGFFVALWLTSARLFRKAAREQSPAGAAP